MTTIDSISGVALVPAGAGSRVGVGVGAGGGANGVSVWTGDGLPSVLSIATGITRIW